MRSRGSDHGGIVRAEIERRNRESSSSLEQLGRPSSKQGVCGHSPADYDVRRRPGGKRTVEVVQQRLDHGVLEGGAEVGDRGLVQRLDAAEISNPVEQRRLQAA